MGKPETLSQKIIMVLIGILVTSMIGWAAWVTVLVIDIDEIKSCVKTNQAKIEQERDRLQAQINARLEKQDAKLERIYGLLIGGK